MTVAVGDHQAGVLLCQAVVSMRGKYYIIQSIWIYLRSCVSTLISLFCGVSATVVYTIFVSPSSLPGSCLDHLAHVSKAALRIRQKIWNTSTPVK